MVAHRIHPYLKIVPLPVLAILLLSCWFLHSSRVEAQVSQNTKVRGLQQQRLATLGELVRLMRLSNEVGHSNPEELWSAIKTKDEAELALCTSNGERMAALEKLVADAKELEEQAAKLVASHFLPQNSFLKLKADRLQQEILLENERAK